MEKLFTSLKNVLAAGQDAVIASIVADSGSTPRGAGAKMLVTKSGIICGTIGGGAIEYEAEKLARSYLEMKCGGTHEFSLSKNQRRDIGMVCGGDITIYFQYISSASAEFAALAEYALKKIKNAEDSWLVTNMQSGKFAVYSGKDGYWGMESPPVKLKVMLSEHPGIQESGKRKFFIEPLSGFGTVYVFGGGHVAQELVPIASRTGFRCVVLDDRPAFTRSELFEGVSETRLVDFEEIGKYITVTPHDYIVIMTRGHQHDSVLQAQAMRTGARYIGVMGSKSKIAHVSAKMRELGFSNEDLARIKTPIGLKIGAETPAEIAVSIVAELIMVRAEGIL